ncbi:hypothetical protein UMM65_06670 [Aureibaculum sp. 2210JD6-5]|uniref:hypothetical protein n=1 Tax=Aureibaculum sp. 2210JD6-5 TaxID=3103957 RepID=UPI002AAE74B5|nr:hypothetical protein [Aureibaculum sp. 2210JD6-5]MDY7394917.1 hypothetical protein [Aureibaculum sp. 2210JD6-5]
MKKTLKLFTLLALFVLLTNCEKETILEQETPPVASESPAKNLIETLNFDELSIDNEFSEISTAFKIDKPFETVKKSGKTEGSIHEGLDIDFTSVKKIRDKNGVSFTLLIKSEEKEPTIFDNLVIEKRKDGEIRGYLMRYEYSKNYLESFRKGILLPFEGKIKRTLYSKDIKALKKLLNKARKGVTKKIVICTETSVLFKTRCPYGGGHLTGTYCHVYGKEWDVYRSGSYTLCRSSGFGYSNSWSVSPYSSGHPDTGQPYTGPFNNTPTTPNAPSTYDSVEDIQSFIKEYSLTGAAIEWARYRENRNLIIDFREENGYSTESKNFVENAMKIINNKSLTTSQKLEQFRAAYNTFDPKLPQDATQDDYEAKIRGYANYFKRRGNQEFADYLTSLLPLDSDYSKEDFEALYETIKEQKLNYFYELLSEIGLATFDAFEPVIEMALWEVGGGLALKVLNKLPVKYLTTPIKNVITRLKTPSSTAFSKLKQAKKYGVKSYAELEKVLKDLGIKRSLEKIDIHHLFEQRFKSVIGGSTSSWKSIVLTKAEHQIFTNAWRKEIGYISDNVLLNTSNATKQQILDAAKRVYKDYPEILKALGL